MISLQEHNENLTGYSVLPEKKGETTVALRTVDLQNTAPWPNPSHRPIKNLNPIRSE